MTKVRHCCCFRDFLFVLPPEGGFSGNVAVQRRMLNANLAEFRQKFGV